MRNQIIEIQEFQAVKNSVKFTGTPIFSVMVSINFYGKNCENI